MKISHVAQNTQQTSFGSFIKLDVPLSGQDSKIAEEMANSFRILAGNQIDIYLRKPGSKSASSIFIDDKNGKYEKGFNSIMQSLIAGRKGFLANAADLFLEKPKKTKIGQKLFGSSYPNLAKFADKAKLKDMVKI